MHDKQVAPGILAKGNPVKVDIVAVIDPDTHQVVFHDTWESDWGKGTSKNQPIIFPQTAQANIHFNLSDKTGLQLKFYPYNPPHQMPTPPADYPIYVGTGPECPPPAGLNGGQITILTSASNLLKVFNNNTSQCTLHYALRFSGNDNIAGKTQAPYVFDPEIRNGGGGVPLQNARSNYVGLLLGVGAAALLGFLAYRAFFN